MIIMSVDYGDVRTGIAVCDKLQILASPVCVITEKDRDEIVRQIKLTLSLYDIMIGEKCAGEFAFVTPAERLENPSIKPIKYVQTRYVNVRNVDRFAVNESHARMLKQLPSHLYEAKATMLFWRCMEQYSQCWWD